MVGVESLLPECCIQAYEQQLYLFNNRKLALGWSVVWKAGIWTLWLVRNNMIFNEKAMVNGKAFELIQLQTVHWIKAKAKDCKISFMDWVQEPGECTKQIGM
ncbi:hypothetical protein SLEP1_g25552 [Rubroshorea leprosula]|uniref:Uncharacterized protein n=1 Tax=Rubroshorea leprosula TaxID=152421 RepID=A0AAV5JV00_9ROSI|nr:hypothetical protein SLEP1_g25552 [Rubroshorea leprosula]